MTTSRFAALALCAVLGLAACSSDVKSNATDATGVTTPATVAATTPGSTVTTAPATTTAATTATTVTTAAATTLAATTTAATTTTTSTTTVPTTTTTAKTTPKTSPKTTPPAPVFTSFSSSVDSCPTTVAPGVSFNPPPDNGTVTVKWTVTGPFDMIYDALDNVNGAFNSNLPASGSDSFSRICDGNKHTVYVVAVYKGTKVVKSKSYQQP